MERTMSYKISRYGWLPDLPDHRDHFYAAPVEWAAVLPARVDLRAGCPPVCDQGQLCSCTANAIAGAIQFDRPWGNRWGMKGYFTLPYAYLTDENLASDFWTIRIVQ
jgi:C1A family cysteine protease